MGDYPGKLLRELPETKLCGLREAFWELTGFGVVRTPKLSEWKAGVIPGWVTTLGSWSVSSQEQNRAGLGPKRTISRYGRAGPGCDNPGIALASNSLNFGVPTNPKPVSSQEQIREGGVGPAQSGQYFARWSWDSPLRHSDLEEASWELTSFGFVGTPKLSELEARAIPGWVTTLGSCSVSSQEQIREGGVGPAQSGQYLARWSWASPLRHSDLGEASWELTGFGFVGTPKLSELEAGAIPGWVTTLGS
ncbi:hypothetical protein L3X38_024868 [Prunus dulcis]|uniref:Uncharacterized protein n=1 Tax=Prunus dulcis TaxID=3755 RepID=A0AAD4Z6J6_PRUDU|nr:hypothetical protein L3X38_024868 [Prunus dulcis]